MSAASKPEPGMSMARTDDRPQADRALAGLDAEGRRQVLEQRMRRANLQAVANESWGSALSPNAQRAIAAYMVRFNLDVGEVEILGGKIYRNGRYYERRIAEMRTAGKVEWSLGDHIGPNPELDAMAAAGDAWAIEEQTRRRRERIRWEVPADATHAYVTRVKLKGDQNPLEGCDWITPKRMKQTKYGPKVADPVGAEEPEKTVITRSWRRAGLLVAAEIPELRAQEEVLDAGAVEVSEEVERIGGDEQARDRSAHRPRELMAGSRADAPYEIDSEAAGNAPEPVTVVGSTPTPAQRTNAATAASVADPYGDDAEEARDGSDAPVDESRETAPKTLSSAHAFALPFNIGLARIRTPLSQISNEDLGKALSFARNVGKYTELVEAISIVLDDRRFGDAQGPSA